MTTEKAKAGIERGPSSMTMPAKARRASKSEGPPAAVPPSAAPKAVQGAELRFHPFAALDEGAPAEYPGLWFKRQGRDAYEISKLAMARVKEGDDRFQSIADLSLGVMNAIAAVFLVPGAEAIRGNPVAEEHDRRSALACFLAGFEAAKLAIATGGVVDAPSIDEVEKEFRSKQGKKAADARHEESRQRREEIQKIWSEGNFADRDGCAEQSWAFLGYNRQKTARNHLNGTPDPDPWPARGKKT